jgi:transcriptional regulator with XRE-family HTH domain
MTIEIADRLVKLRKKYGYSQEELADKLGLSRQAVSKWERAEASPDTDNLICLAKLYGVSLDELLATDEDIDTIVKEQVKEEKKENESESDKEENAEKKSGDRVVFDDDGIHINDKNGKRVIINDDGVKCYDANGNVVKHVDKHNHDKVMAVIGAVEGALFLIAVAGFLLLGLLGGFWSSAWIVFFLPDIICSIARAIRKKDANQYNMTFTACFAFFFVCMFMHDVAGIPQLWNPMWVVFLAIPIYHAIIGSIHTALGKKDDDDDDDDDEKEDKGDVDFTKDED